MANCYPTFSSSSFQLSSALTSVRGSKGILTWKPMVLLALMMIVGAEAQTFQYSRGWTNGKRTGGLGFGVQGPYEAVESGDSLDILPPGHLQMSLGPQGGRYRAMDYSQYLAKRMQGGKQPLWFGTILGVDETAAGAGGASPSNSLSSNNIPSSRSRTSTSDF